MRTILAVALWAGVVACVSGQTHAPGSKGEITDTVIIQSCGSSLAKMFAQYGLPSDVWVERGKAPEQDDVFFDYGGYGFRVREKRIRICFFFREWKESIRGVRIGDSREQVMKVRGMPRITVKNKEGAITAYGYDEKEQKATFYANFDKNGKVWRVEISLK